MTLAIAARVGNNVVCASDLAVTVGATRFKTPTIKGVHIEESFVLYAGDANQCHEILNHPTLDFDTARHAVAIACGEDYEAEFIQVTESTSIPEIYLIGNHDVFGPFEEYVCIGSGSDLARSILDYRLLEGRPLKTLTAAKREFGRIYSVVSNIVPSVSREWKSEVI